MKIIRLTTFLDFGGVEKRLINISQYNDQHEWLFCALNKGGFAENEIRENGKRVFCFNYKYSIPSIETIYKLYLFFKKEKPDVIHTSGAEANFHGVIAAKMVGIKTIVAEEIGIPSHSKKAKLIFNIIYKMADYIIGNSGVVIDCLRNETHVSISKLRLVPNPILFPDIPKRSMTELDEFTIISVSRLDKVKNIDLVLDILPDLLKIYKIKYLILGDGMHRERLEYIVHKLHLENFVQFVGFIEDPYPYWSKSNLFILNSFSEGFSNALVEAMYSGIPVLATKVGAAEDIINNGVNGWLIDPNDRGSLLETLTRIIDMSLIERENIGINGQRAIAGVFSLDKHISLLYNIYCS